MTAAIPKVGRAFLIGLAAGLTACSDGSAPLVPTPQTPPRLLVYGGTETLASGLNLTNGSSVTWNVSMPSSGTIRLSFDGRINYGSTAGNSTILQLKVNGTPVTANLLFNKDSIYTYPNRGNLKENYFANRGAGWGQADRYWGLFWSPNFTANNSSSNQYYVSGGKAYNYVLTITGLVNYGQVNTIEMVNQGAWVQSATGNSPTIVLQNVKVQSVVPPPLAVYISGSSHALPNQSCYYSSSVGGGTPPYTYRWYVDGALLSTGPDLWYYNFGWNYSVDLWVTDAAGTVKGDWVSVWVDSNGWC
ncbi:MAG TPA: hypothetical protein VEQ60_25895 [Longimicrobium sp.]|nr:hypothetical protein [Longimicrobium sp.]